MSGLSVYLAMLMLGSNFSATTVEEKPVQQCVQNSVQQLPAQQQSAQRTAPVATELPQPKDQTKSKAAPQMTEEEQRFVNLVNQERALKGLKTLKVDPVLIEVSREHSKEMSDKNYFDHNSPTPGKRTALDRYLAAVKQRPTWAIIGENLFYCSIVDVNRGHTCLMNSKGHRDNIINPKFERIGVGVYKSKTGEFWVTQMFIASVN